MRKFIALLLLPALAMFVAGCAMHKTPVMPPEGLLFTQFKAPLTVDFNGTKVGQDLKTGSAKTLFLFIPFIGSFAWERCDVEIAAQSAGIKTIHYADYEVLKVLGIFCEFTVHVHGE